MMDVTHTANRPRRSLILAGGGTKVAFQAGVLQVWLDEAGLQFDHADGASGGVFNAAMWAQGMSGRQIADNWRRFQPLSAIDPDFKGLLLSATTPSLFTLKRFQRHVMGGWGLDWKAIQATPREVTFNLYNFTKHELVVLESSEMDEDRLLSAVSLPIWFPPVAIDGDTYIDAVYATDANLEEAIRRGANELWVIWTVSLRGTWKAGFAPQYFQIIEAAANSQLKAVLNRIERNNATIAAAGVGEFGRHVTVKCLQAEVPLHYLFNFRRDRIAMAVELGVAAARRWCVEEGISLSPPETSVSPSPPSPVEGIHFTEHMAGFATMGCQDPEEGWRLGADEGNRLRFRLTIEVDDLDQFATQPEHAGTARGWVDFDSLGGRFPVRAGQFNLFIDQEDPGHKRMLYRLHFIDSGGFPLTLLGEKKVQDDPGHDLWADTTTLYTRILRGHVDWPEADLAQTVAAGIMRITPLSFLRQLTTFRARGETVGRRLEALSRFGRLFAGKLWDVYVISDPGPR
jgi:predicted acylesterase/phospholipase RssA